MYINYEWNSSKACHPAKGRRPMAEQIRATYDFQKWFEKLGTKLTGHGSHGSWKDKALESCHVYRFVKRASLPAFSADKVESTFKMEPHGNDIILLVKLRMGSECYAQPPQVFIPNDFFNTIQGSRPEVASRALLSEQQCAEFQKTANHVCKPPWNMIKSQNYLTKLVVHNVAGESVDWNVPVINWVFQPKPLAVPPMNEMVLSKETEQTTPVWVQAGPVPKRHQVPDKRNHAKDVSPAERPGVPVAERPCVPVAAGAPEGMSEAGAPNRGGVLPAAKVGKAKSIPPHPEKLIFGCSQCRQSQNGCRKCRAKLGWALVDHLWQAIPIPPPKKKGRRATSKDMGAATLVKAAAVKSGGAPAAKAVVPAKAMGAAKLVKAGSKTAVKSGSAPKAEAVAKANAEA